MIMLSSRRRLSYASGPMGRASLRSAVRARRISAHEVISFADLYPALAPGELLAGTLDRRFKDAWELADPQTFRPKPLA
jgi:hypothetical protein